MLLKAVSALRIVAKAQHDAHMHMKLNNAHTEGVEGNICSFISIFKASKHDFPLFIPI